ncbi:MAG: hypothetical protein K2M19_01300 [Muribaculaceae bacterium]|nr:hypothetical protein [Muribaculaceae bacterium]
MGRHQFRADWHDYNVGIYFITICTHDRRHLFGEIAESEMMLSPLGCLVESAISDLPAHHDIKLLNHVVMPNHVHILVDIGNGLASDNIDSTGAGCIKPAKFDKSCSRTHYQSRLSVVLRSLKAYVTYAANRKGLNEGKIWQRLYHDHIVRSQDSFDRIWNYIDNNVTNWDQDCFKDQ